MSEMAEVSEVSVLADEPVSFEADEEENKVIIYEQVNKIDIDDDTLIEKEEIEVYLSKRPEYNKVVVPEGFKADFSQPLQLGTEVQLNEAGFIEVEFQAEVTNTKPSGGSTGGSGGGSASKLTPTTLEEPAKPAGAPATMYRLYNRLIDELLYTTNKAKRDDLLTCDTWKDEGEGWIAPSVSDYPVYRLLNPNNGDHHYTIDKNEFDTLPSLCWVAEGVAFFSAHKDNPENVILHRV